MDFYSRSPNPRVSLLREDLLIVVMVVACVVGALVLSGCGRSDVEVTAASEREAADRKADVTPREYLALIRPVNCDATVHTRGAGQKWKSSCYTRKT